MKRSVLLAIIFSSILGCNSQRSIKFCEGVSPDGEGINCGSTFSTGALTIIVKSREPFGVDQITVGIFRKKGYRKEKIESLPIEVKADKSTVSSNINLYEEGNYIIEVRGKDDQLATGEVEIIDVY